MERKYPLWLKRLPLIGQLFWNRGPRMLEGGYVLYGLLTGYGWSPHGQWSQTTDADGDIVRRKGRYPFAMARGSTASAANGISSPHASELAQHEQGELPAEPGAKPHE